MAIQASTSVPASPGADPASPPRAGVWVVQMPISSFGSLPDADALQNRTFNYAPDLEYDLPRDKILLDDNAVCFDQPRHAHSR